MPAGCELDAHRRTFAATHSADANGPHRAESEGARDF